MPEKSYKFPAEVLLKSKKEKTNTENENELKIFSAQNIGKINGIRKNKQNPRNRK